MRLIEFLQFEILLRHIGLPVGQRDFACLLRPCDGVFKAPCFRAGVGQGLNLDRFVRVGQRAGARGQLDGFGAVAECGVRVGGEEPRQIIQRVGKIGLKLQRGAVLGDGSGDLALGRQRQGPLEMDRGVLRVQARALGELLFCGFIFALPGQSETKWEETLQAALACAPKHISAYALTYEEDTPFFKKLQQGEWREDEAREIAMFERTRDVLGAAGFVDYEISNFATPSFESQHNLAYWRGTDYLGLGPSACSTVGGLRWRNASDTRAYAEQISLGESVRGEMETLDAATRTKERIMFGLRMREGVLRTEFGGAESQLGQLAVNGLAFDEGGRVRLTARGKLVADSIAGMFV